MKNNKNSLDYIYKLTAYNPWGESYAHTHTHTHTQPFLEMVQLENDREA